MQRKLILVTVLLCIALSAYAADGFSIKSEVDKDRISTDEALKLTVSFTGAAGKTPEIKLPKLDEFYVLTSGSSFNFSTRGGKTESINSITVFLRPKHEGQITIGPASVNYEGKEYKTRPIKIAVKKGKLPLPQEPKPKTHPKAPYKKGAEITI
ncbi:MAG: BatD family protein [Candidatus Omnitrophota bacterium]